MGAVDGSGILDTSGLRNIDHILIIASESIGHSLHKPTGQLLKSFPVILKLKEQLLSCQTCRVAVLYPVTGNFVSVINGFQLLHTDKCLISGVRIQRSRIQMKGRLHAMTSEQLCQSAVVDLTVIIAEGQCFS